MQPFDDTIVAIASAPGGAARGIVRLSGPAVDACLDPWFSADGGATWKQAAKPAAWAGQLRLPDFATPLPCDLYLWPGGQSYTGQPVVEIHTLGSPPLLDAAVDALCSAGARLADPGEFTLRAFLSGRIDLTQAEAVLGVIDAADPCQLHTALGQLAGGLAAPLGKLRDRLLDLLAELEAGLDFADEDLDVIEPESVVRLIDEAAQQVAAIVRQMRGRGETVERDRVVLCGPANAGKSSLFNALLDRREAIVCETPGTTRDYLTADWQFAGRKLQLVDTAGAAAATPGTPDEIHRAAQSHTRAESQRAELRLVCIDASRPLTAEAQQFLADDSCPRLVVLTKCDLPAQVEVVPTGLRTSNVTGEGMDELRRAIEEALHRGHAPGGEVVASTAARCRESLRRASADLDRARSLAVVRQGDELIAAEVRAALDELGRVVGAVYTDDVLDRIFSRFCIGK